MSQQPVTERDFKGKWLFIYFGFTYCPDICPNELVRMKEVINTLGEGVSILKSDQFH
jgi:protein SCO1